MMEFRTGDGCEWDAMFRIEKALNMKLDDAEWRKLSELTLQGTVEYLASKVQSSHTLYPGHA